MNAQALKTFFMWCTIINVALFAVSAVMIMAVPDFIYGIHGEWFHLPREAFNVILYAFLGLYKILILIFNVVPYVALVIIGRQSDPAT